jgi:hypothetical protein
MRISIRHNGDDIVEFNQFKVNGREAAGGYGFTFLLKGNRRGCENPMAIFDIRLSLALSAPVKPVLTSIPSSIQIIQCTQYPNNNEQLSFEVLLTKEQVNALEEYRQDKDLKLNLGLKALTSSGGTLLSNYDCEDFIVPREHWLKALSNSGFRQTLLFEVPLPSTAYELVGLYLKAQEFIETGHYKDAVMQCRHILEHTEAHRDDKALAQAANKKAQNRQERQDMSAIERMLSMREQIKNVCQLGAHGPENFTRSQAKSVLGMTMALLADPTVGVTDSMTHEENKADVQGIVE